MADAVKRNDNVFDKDIFVSSINANYEVTNHGRDTFITYSVEIQSKEAIHSLDEMSIMLANSYLKSKGLSLTLDELIKQVIPEELL